MGSKDTVVFKDALVCGTEGRRLRLRGNNRIKRRILGTPEKGYIGG